MRSVENCPPSEVSSATGHVGALALGVLVVIAFAFDLPVAAAVPLFLLGTAVPMVLWDLAIEKVHRRPSTGLDFSLRPQAEDVLPIVLTKTIGLFATWTLIGVGYFAIKYYMAKQFSFYFALLELMLPALVVLAPAYLWLTTCLMTEPKDGLWHFGRLISLERGEVDLRKVADHLRSWLIKAFFLAFMISIFPNIVHAVMQIDLSRLLSDPTALAIFLVRLMFLFDVCFGTIGYILTLRPLDSHVRSANPLLGGWVAALICYPPFAVMGNGGPLDYRAGSQEWLTWFAGQDALLILWGGVIVALVFIYAWSTVIFGIRFSNLTHRGIITNGPYRYFRHPAYLSKNLTWWLIHLPFLSAVDSTTALQNCVLLLMVNGIYYLRAKTEEQHLEEDARYRAYSAWIERHGILPRLRAPIAQRLASFGIRVSTAR
ncbi:MAG: methyltransferase family protein [Geminicoccaceae bacterium]